MDEIDEDQVSIEHEASVSKVYFESQRQAHAEFARLYNGSAYEELKRGYDPDGRLAGLYDKCVGEK